MVFSKNLLLCYHVNLRVRDRRLINTEIWSVLFTHFASIFVQLIFSLSTVFVIYCTIDQTIHLCKVIRVRLITIVHAFKNNELEFIFDSVLTYYPKRKKHLLPSFFKITIIPSRTPIILHRSSGRKKALMVHLNGLKGNRL